MKIWRKRSVLVFMVLLLVIAAYPGGWNSKGIVHAAEEFAGGEGTTDEPYWIATADQLNEIRNYLDQHFILVSNIELSAYNSSDPWVPIGNADTPFTGSLNGQHYTITNLYVNNSSSGEPTGLFGGIGATGHIQNLTVEAVEVSGSNYVGVLAGVNEGTIDRVSVTGNVSGQINIGGLIGYNSGHIVGGHATGDVTGELYVGGLAGENASGAISNSHASGVVIGSSDVGGLVGNNHDGDITYSYATGNVTGIGDVGGLIGMHRNAELLYSYATGHVAGCEDSGGLVGDNDYSLISNSYATGNMTGIVEGTSCSDVIYSDSIGGIAGDNHDGEIVNSFAISRVIAGTPSGGLVGRYGNGIITNSYYDKEISSQVDETEEGRTTEEMKNPLTFIGWDLGTVWEVSERHHQGYPYLKEIQAFITYSGNDGMDDTDELLISLSYPPNTTVTIQEKDNSWSKTGHLFYGWNTAADGSGETYRAGDELALTGSLMLYADWQQPAVPVLLIPADNQFINNNMPTISGTADADVTVAIHLDGGDEATVTAAGDGSWAWTPSVALAEGLHTVSTGVIDSTGNLTSLSLEHEFTVDTESPVITLQGDASMTITAGTDFVDPGITITDTDDDVTVTVTGSVDDQAAGTYTLQYDATDRAGNVAVPVTRTVQVNPRYTGGGSVSLSSNADLAQLTVKAAGEQLALTPAFAADTIDYFVKTRADEVAIEAIPSDIRATVTLGDAALDGEKKVALVEGDNGFQIVVKAENGTTKTYSLTVQRQTEPAPLPQEGAACTFLDISGHWAEKFICEATEKRIVEGHSETVFQPQGLITRVEFAAILLRTLGITSGGAVSELVFTDQEQIPSWAKNTVSIAVENDILEGYPDRTLRPMHTVSRSEMVVMLAKAMKWKVQEGATSFTDDGDIPNWAKVYIHDVVQRGLLSGRGGNRFAPTEAATRAEATVLLLRLWHLNIEGEGKE